MKIVFVLFLTYFGFWASHAAGRTLISGALSTNDKRCTKSDYQVFLNQDRQLIHQFMVPPNGTFSVDVIPGHYENSAKNIDKCVYRSELNATSGENHKLTLKPESLNRQPASELASNCMCVRYPCPCQGGGGVFTTPPYIAPSWNPWWLYQAPLYSNFYYPGPWMGWGLNGGFYPGGGHVGLAKPNVYLHGEKGTTVNLKVIPLDSKANWLVTVPDHANRGWDVQLGERRLRANNAEYPYLYYDMRTHEAPLQAEHGFCDDRNESLKKMSSILKEVGFTKTEIADFDEYWQIKMPPNRVCVFPQMSAELDKLVALKINPTPSKILRTVFVVAYEDAKKSKYTGKFNTKPTTEWSFANTARNVKRQPGSASGLEIHEWGVAFLFEK